MDTKDLSEIAEIIMRNIQSLKPVQIVHIYGILNPKKSFVSFKEDGTTVWVDKETFKVETMKIDLMCFYATTSLMRI